MTNRNEVTNHEQEALIAAKDALRRFERGDSSQDEDALRNLIDRFEIVVSERDSLRLAWEDAEAHVAALLRTPTPTDDEREALLTEADAVVASWDRRGSWDADSPVGMVMRLATTLRRSVVPEPSAPASLKKSLGGKSDDELCPECRGELTSWFCDTCGNTGLVKTSERVLFVGAPGPELDDVESVIVRVIHDLGPGWKEISGTDLASNIAAALRAAGVVS